MCHYSQKKYRVQMLQHWHLLPLGSLRVVRHKLRVLSMSFVLLGMTYSLQY